MKRHLSMAALVVATVGGMIPTAHAITNNQAGINWHAYYNSSAPYISYSNYPGVRSYKSTQDYVIGSINFNNNAGGISMTLWGTNYGSGTYTGFVVYSATGLGAYRSSQVVYPSGNYAQWVGLSASQVPANSFVSVLVTLPANGNGVFYGANVNS